MKAAGLLLTVAGLLGAQIVPNPTQTPRAQQTSDAPQPIFRVTVVSRTTKAVNYHHRQGSTKIDFRGTAIMPEARGDAKVESNTGATKMSLHFDKLSAAGRFGPEYLTYVLWAVTPEGRAKNLGEIVIKGNGDKADLDATTDLQSFGMIVTAEPYWAVTQPSDVVVMENFIRTDTTGTIEQVDAKFELLQRGTYTRTIDASQLTPLTSDMKVPLQLREARQAMAIAKATGAEKYAADTWQKAQIDMVNAEGYLHGKSGKKPLETVAREATQMAEDARIITIRKLQAEELASERASAAQREADAKAATDAEARRRAQAETETAAAQQATVAAQQAKMQADQARAAAEAASAQAARDREAANAARQAALAQQQAAQMDAEKSRLAAQQAEQQALLAQKQVQQSEAEKAELRQRILTQLNLILETRDTARGLIVNMSDVLFDTGKSTLRSGAREKLAKVGGIVLAYPTLRLAVEGHTDSVGGDEYNQRLSERRAEAVRDYLTAQGINMNSVTARGFGKTLPVASNDNAAGRQQNRRVELVVSGDVIGTPIGPNTMQQPQTNPGVNGGVNGNVRLVPEPRP